MYRPRRFFFALALAAVLATAIARSPALAQEDPVVARVNGAEIMLSQVVAFQETLPDQYRNLPLEALFPALLERMIDFSLITAEGRSANLQDDEEVRRRVALAESNIIRDVYLERLIDEGVSEEALAARYDTVVRDGPPVEEVSARHILVEDEATAREIIERIKGGADFAEVAAEASIGPSGPNGGDIGYFTREAVVPEFSEAAFALEPGMMTEEPVQTQFGWHVIKVEDRRIAPPPAFEEVRDQLASEISQELVNDLVARLREGAEIERFNADGSPAAALPQ